MELFTPSALPGKVLPEPSHGVSGSRPVGASRTPSHGLISQLFSYIPCFFTQTLPLHTNVQTNTQPLQYYFARPTVEGAPPRWQCPAIFRIYEFNPPVSITKNHRIWSQLSQVVKAKDVSTFTTFATPEFLQCKVSCY